MTLWELFALFFYIGLFTIGGGQVAITLMYQELVEGGIIDAQLFYNMLAISESTPGPIGINMATYLGYELFGIAGGILTTAGTVAPSIIIILIIARHFGKIQDKPLVKNMFTVLRPVATGLLYVAAWNVFLISVIVLPRAQETGIWYSIFDLPRTLAWIVMTVMLFKTKLAPVLYIALGAIFGIIAL